MDRKIEILIAHSVDVSCDRGRVWALSRASRFVADSVVDASEWLDVTDWSVREIYHWLGY
jgi:hypothetical protein